MNHEFSFCTAKGHPSMMQVIGEKDSYLSDGVDIYPVQMVSDKTERYHLWDTSKKLRQLECDDMMRTIKMLREHKKPPVDIQRQTMSPVASGIMVGLGQDIALGFLVHPFDGEPLFPKRKKGGIDVPKIYKDIHDNINVSKRLLSILLMAWEHGITLGLDNLTPHRIYANTVGDVRIYGLGIQHWIDAKCSSSSCAWLPPKESLSCLAPEKYEKSQGNCHEKISVYGIAALLYSTLSMSVPYQKTLINGSMADLIQVIVDPEVAITFEPELKKELEAAWSSQALATIEACLSFNPQDRPGMRALSSIL